MHERQLIWLYGGRLRMLQVSLVVALVVGIGIALEGNDTRTAIEAALGLFAFQAITGELIGRQIRNTVAKRSQANG